MGHYGPTMSHLSCVPMAGTTVPPCPTCLAYRWRALRSHHVPPVLRADGGHYGPTMSHMSCVPTVQYSTVVQYLYGRGCLATGVYISIGQAQRDSPTEC